LSGALRERLHSLNGEWLSLMRAGRYSQAWHVSDQALALRASLDCSQWPRHEQFIWKGQALGARSVLIRCYHGLGDTIQFVRFVPRARRIAREVTLWVQPELIPLLATMNCADRILPLHDGAPDVEYDIDVELAELAHVLRVTPEEVGRSVPYLRVAPADAGLRRDAFRVGLVWAAGTWNARRSLRSELLSSFESISGVEWILMQRGPALADWQNSFGSLPHIETIVDEARALEALDLLISVDTCSAHLAGALGVPVWTLLPHDADWRWMERRSDTPWYPSMRLFRQPRPGAWDAVLAEVDRELRELVSPASKRIASRYPFRVPTST
jgi:hypothetical protein